MQITNIVCKADVKLPVERQFYGKYRGNTIHLTKSGATLFLTKNQEEIICDINFGSDLSEFLTQKFREPLRITPRISQFTGARTFKREKNTVTDLLRNLDEKCAISKLFVYQGKHCITLYTSNQLSSLLWKRGSIDKIHFVSLLFKANEGKITGKIQVGRCGLEYFTTYIVTDFGKKTLAFIEVLEQQQIT